MQRQCMCCGQNRSSNHRNPSPFFPLGSFSRGSIVRNSSKRYVSTSLSVQVRGRRGGMEIEVQRAFRVVFRGQQRGAKVMIADYSMAYQEAISFLEKKGFSISAKLQIHHFVRGLRRDLRMHVRKAFKSLSCIEGLQEAVKHVEALDLKIKKQREGALEKRGVVFQPRNVPGCGLRHADEVECIIKNGCCMHCLRDDHRKGDPECYYGTNGIFKFTVGN